MTRPDSDTNEAWLNTALADLQDTPVLSQAFMAQLTADALKAQPLPLVVATRQPWWQQALEAFGGWGGLSGLAAATVVGFAVGIGGPAQVDSTLFDVIGAQTFSEDVVTSLDLDWTGE